MSDVNNLHLITSHDCMDTINKVIKILSNKNDMYTKSINSGVSIETASEYTTSIKDNNSRINVLTQVIYDIELKAALTESKYKKDY